MSEIMGIGTKREYIYNSRTRKLSMGDGKADDTFVKYFNGDLDTNSKEASEVNGFAYRTKGGIKELFDSGAVQIDDKENHKVSINIKELGETEYVVDDDKKVYADAGMLSFPQELVDILFERDSFKTTEHKDYNPEDNSIHIAVGDSIEWNGNMYEVGDDKVTGAENVKGTKKEKEDAYKFQSMLTTLIHFGDQQYYGSALSSEKYGPLALEFLKSQGIDTDKDFIINETKARKNQEGGLEETDGNYMHLSSTIYNSAMAKYAKWANSSIY